MHWLWLLVILISWIVAAVWTQRTLAALRNLPRVPNLLDARYAPQAAEPSPGLPRIAVIVPARNEASAIEATLRSLLAQTIPVEIIAVDDRSTDSTGSIMDRVAAEPLPPGKSLRVLHVKALPEGWLGKPYAMAFAARHATTPWLLFTDADVIFAPDVLARALSFATESQADHLVLMPTLTLQSPGERTMVAIFQYLSLLSWRPWKIADPAAKRDSIGIGAFNMVRAQAYHAIGGFEARPMEILDDLWLGFSIKQRGFRQHIVFGRDLIRLHWAAGALGLAHNLTKNIFATFRFRPLVLLAAALCLALLCFAPIAGCFAPWPVRAPSLLSLLMMALHYRYSARHFSGIPAYYALTLPLGVALVLYAMLRSMVLTLVRRGIVWRGTFYPLRELRRHSGRLR